MSIHLIYIPVGIVVICIVVMAIKNIVVAMRDKCDEDKEDDTTFY